jgi:hypothetical protein
MCCLPWDYSVVGFPPPPKTIYKTTELRRGQATAVEVHPSFYISKVIIMRMNAFVISRLAGKKLGSWSKVIAEAPFFYAVYSNMYFNMMAEC